MPNLGNLIFICMSLFFSASTFANENSICRSSFPNLPPRQKEITVAVIDTGLDTKLSAIHNNLWINPGETGLDDHGRDKSINGLDDDGNGYIDDVHGWNFGANNNDLSDSFGHGTHISSLIISGGRQWLDEKPKLNMPVKIMVLKYHDAKHSPVRGLAFQKALHYVLSQKVDLVHISGGGYEALAQERRLLKRLESRNIPVVAASGNKKPSDLHSRFFPASYPFKNLYRVSATSKDGKILETTNESPGLPYIRMNGENIISLLPGNKRGRLTGTSQAAARFTGRMVLFWSTVCKLR